MRKLLLVKVTLFSIILFSSCEDEFICERGHGPVVTKEISLSSFNKIDVSGDFEVVIKKGEHQLVEVEGQENIIDLVNKRVIGDSWKIEFKHCVRRKEDVNIYITVPSIEEVSVSGSSKVNLQDVFEEDELHLDLSGSGRIAGQFLADKIKSKISGSGKLELSGEAEESQVDISGSGDFNGFDLNTQISRVKISGSGKAEVFVEKSIFADISGSGKVYYKGNPSHVNSNITGSGKIVDAN